MAGEGIRTFNPLIQTLSPGWRFSRRRLSTREACRLADLGMSQVLILKMSRMPIQNSG